MKKHGYRTESVFKDGVAYIAETFLNICNEDFKERLLKIIM